MSPICDDCPNKQKLMDLEESIKSNAEQHRDFYNKFEKIHIDFAIMTTKFEQIISMITNLQLEVKAMQNEISSLKEKPAKRWEGVITTAISALVSGLVAYLLIRGGLK